MRWVNLPIYTDLKLHPIINRGQTYDGQDISLSPEGVVLSYPSKSLVSPYVRPRLCLNPRYLFFDFGYYDGLTGSSMYGNMGAELIGVSDNHKFFGGFRYLTLDGYRADSPYYYINADTNNLTGTSLGSLSNTYLYSIEVKFNDAVPSTQTIQLDVAGHLSMEQYAGVEAGQTLLFTWDGAFIYTGNIQFTDTTITTAVAKASTYRQTGYNYAASEYPAIAINGYYAMEGLLFNGRYILGRDVNNKKNLLYSELPLNIQSLYIGETITAVGHYKDSIFVFTDASVFETNLKQVSRVCNMIPNTASPSVVSTDLGIYVLAHNSVYFLQNTGFNELIHFDFPTYGIAPSWTNKSVYVMTEQGLYEVSFYGVWKVQVCSGETTLPSYIHSSGIYVAGSCGFFKLELDTFSSITSELKLQTDILPERLHILDLRIEATNPEDIEMDIVGQSDNRTQEAKVRFTSEGKAIILNSPPRALVSGQKFKFHLKGLGQSRPNIVRNIWVAVLSGSQTPARR